MNKILLHVEGAALLILALYGYMYFEFNWWILLIFLLAPDLSMVGYLFNERIGAVIYNSCHTYTLSIGLFLIGVITGQDLFVLISLIWTAHIGMDRLFGFGLKYPTTFQDTHLNRV